MAPHIDLSKYPQLYLNMQAGNYLKTSSIQFGCVQFEENMTKGVNQIFTNAGLSSKLSFGSIHFFKKREEKIQKQYIWIDSVIVMFDDAD
jgi:hypothetical protein